MSRPRLVRPEEHPLVIARFLVDGTERARVYAAEARLSDLQLVSERVWWVTGDNHYRAARTIGRLLTLAMSEAVRERRADGLLQNLGTMILADLLINGDNRTAASCLSITVPLELARQRGAATPSHQEMEDMLEHAVMIVNEDLDPLNQNYKLPWIEPPDSPPTQGGHPPHI